MSVPPAGRTVALTADTVSVGRSREADITIDDSEVSLLHCELSATPEGIVLRDLSSTNGTFVGGVRVREAVLTETCRIRVGESELSFAPSPYRQPDLSLKSDAFGRLIGQSPAMKRLYRALETVAPTDLSVLITGETGTGKEVVAREHHDGRAPLPPRPHRYSLARPRPGPGEVALAMYGGGKAALASSRLSSSTSTRRGLVRIRRHARPTSP